MRRLVVLVGLLAALASSAVAGETLKVGRKGKVFKTGDGVNVIVVPVEPAGSKKVLVQISGTSSTWDGKVFLNEIHEWNNNVDYKTHVDGKPYVMITVRSQRYEAYLPGVKGSLNISYDEAKSDALRPDEVLKQYEAQQSRPK